MITAGIFFAKFIASSVFCDAVGPPINKREYFKFSLGLMEQIWEIHFDISG